MGRIMKGSQKYVNVSQRPDPVPRRAEPERLEQPVDEALLAEHRVPGERLHEVARPERREHGDDEDVPRTRRGDTRHVVGDRKGEDRVGDRDEAGHLDRPPGDVAIDVLLEDPPEVVEVPVADDVVRERLRVPERRHQQQHERADVDDDEPGQRRGEQGRRAGRARDDGRTTRAAASGSPEAAAQRVGTELT